MEYFNKYKEKLEKDFINKLAEAKKEYEEKLKNNEVLQAKFNLFLPILETLYLEVNNVTIHELGIRIYTNSIDDKFRFFNSEKRVQQQHEIKKMANKIDNLFNFCVRVIPSSLEDMGISKDLQNTVVFDIPLIPYSWKF